IGVTHQPDTQILFFLLARLISPFVAPGQYSGFIYQKSITRRNTPFCCRLHCRLLPANIAGNKRTEYRPRDESGPIDCFLPLRAEPFVGRQSVSSITTKRVTLRGRHHLVPEHLA
ncbi:hypothetical protein ALC56_00639, partial [Trachymyrmex septentrionalis]